LGSIEQDAVGQNGAYTILNQPATWVEVEVVPEPCTFAMAVFGCGLLLGCVGHTELRKQFHRTPVIVNLNSLVKIVAQACQKTTG
jgi:hypothetical protein